LNSSQNFLADTSSDEEQVFTKLEQVWLRDLWRKRTQWRRVIWKEVLRTFEASLIIHVFESI
jgi:hypothetical protein